MRVLLKPSARTAQKDVAISLDTLRTRQEQRLKSAWDAWEAEKKNLEAAVVRAEAKEREFREVSDDVKRRLEALLLAASMASEMEMDVPFERSLSEPARYPMLPLSAPSAGKTATAFSMPEMNSEPVDVLISSTSRPLFTAAQRARAGEFSILP